MNPQISWIPLNFHELPCDFNWSLTVSNSRVYCAPAFSKATWTEVGIAFEANMGCRIGTPQHDLGDKASIMHYAVAALLRRAKVANNGKTSSHAAAFQTSRTSTPFSTICGDRRAPGLTRRPVMDDDTAVEITRELHALNKHHMEKPATKV